MSPKKKSFESRLKILIGELGLRLIKISTLAILGGAVNYFVHQESENKLVNGLGNIVTIAIAAGANTKKS